MSFQSAASPGVKLLDGCFDPFDTFWVFAAGLTEVGVTLTVEDTESDLVRLYETRSAGASSRSAAPAPSPPVREP